MNRLPGPQVVVIRHGATQWSASGKHTGRTDVTLTADGERQAARLASALSRFDFGLVLASPLKRASYTARLAGLAAIESDPDLQEWDYGEYEGLTTAQIRDQRPGWLLWRDGVVRSEKGNGETASDVGLRADRIVSRITPVLAVGRDVALVSHAHFLRVLAARWLELAPEAGAYFALDTASVSVLGFEHGERVISRWNMTLDV
jgi:broad specificity phosphatase PhoE